MKALGTEAQHPAASSLLSFVCVIGAAVLIFAGGCPPAKPHFEPVPIEPNLPGPVAEPGAIEPPAHNETVPPLLEPVPVEPNVVEPTTVTDVNVTESNEPQPPRATLEPNLNPPSRPVLFHDKCLSILTRFVNGRGRVDYRRLKLKRADLDALLDDFAKLDPNEYERWPKEDKIALWINVYNMQLLRVIIENYPIKSSRIYRLLWPPASIRHIEPTGVFGSAKWDRYKFLVKHEEFTLSEIERRFFRKEFNEPRVFFALTQACLSGPPLRNEPYTGEKLYDQLDDQVRKFLASLLAFRIDREKQKVFLSALFDPTWYGEDFIEKYGTDKKFKAQKPAVQAVLNFITNYIGHEKTAFLETEYYTVGYITFDWRLNDAAETY
jgi:hypothetical protein